MLGLRRRARRDPAAASGRRGRDRLLIRAALTGERGRRLHIRGEITDGAEVLAEARGAFLHVPLEHFLATPEGRASADAWRARLNE